MNISIAGKIITLWGVLVLLGWSLSTMPLNFFGQGYVTSALQLWTVLMAIGLIATYKWFPAAMQNKVVHVWTVIVGGYILLNWANYYRLLPSAVAPYVYLHGWILFTAIGFALTALWWTPKSKLFYAGGALANVVLLILLLARFPGVQQNALLLAGLVGGLPIIADGLMNYKLPPKAAASSSSAPAAPSPMVEVTRTTTTSYTPAKPSTGKKVVVRIVAK